MKNENWRFDLGHPTWSTNPGRLCCSQENQRVERCAAQPAAQADGMGLEARSVMSRSSADLNDTFEFVLNRL